jgi:hypothetical protein
LGGGSAGGGDARHRYGRSSRATHREETPASHGFAS